MNKNVKRFAFGAALAAAAGYVAGILTAPKSGKETRSDVKRVANKALIESEKTLKKLHSELNLLVNNGEAQLKKLSGKAKNQLSQKLQIAKKTKQKTREILTALHDGKADDRELKTAIKEAKSARNHLKAFFKK